MIRSVRCIICTSAVFLSTLHCGLALAAWPSAPNVNVPVSTASGTQDYPEIASDGAGGAIVTWNDRRSNWDIYAQRLDASGMTQWTANGVALCTDADEQFNPAIVSDGAGGAIVTWQDSRVGATDIYAQRMNAAGVPQWTVDGVAICTAANSQYFPRITSDGAGGAVITWQDSRSGVGNTAADIYAQRVDAAGIPQWPVDGVALCTAAHDQSIPMIASDGAGGSIVTWYDLRNGLTNDIYAQRVNAEGVIEWTANGVALCAAESD